MVKIVKMVDGDLTDILKTGQMMLLLKRRVSCMDESFKLKNNSGKRSSPHKM
jgi:hypothetical protein